MLTRPVIYNYTYENAMSKSVLAEYYAYAIIQPINSMQFISAILPWVQIVLSVLLIIAVLFQQTEAGLGAGFGGNSGESFQRTRRGAEKFLLNATIILGILFALASLAALFVHA